MLKKLILRLAMMVATPTEVITHAVQHHREKVAEQRAKLHIRRAYDMAHELVIAAHEQADILRSVAQDKLTSTQDAIAGLASSAEAQLPVLGTATVTLPADPKAS